MDNFGCGYLGFQPTHQNQIIDFQRIDQPNKPSYFTGCKNRFAANAQQIVSEQQCACAATRLMKIGCEALQKIVQQQNAPTTVAAGAFCL